MSRAFTFAPLPSSSVEFQELGSRAAVDEALSWLANEGIIRRLRRGLYDYPRLHPALGPVPLPLT